MGETNGKMSRILTTEQFPANGSVIKMGDVGRPNWGLSIEKLRIEIGTRNPGVVGVDFTGVSYGLIRQVSVSGQRSPGSIAFLFSDRVGFGCWWNVAEQVSAGLVETAFKYSGLGNNTGINTLRQFQAIDVLYGVWTESGGGISLNMENGYVANGSWFAPERKAFKHAGGSPLIHGVNIGTEGFPANDDYDIGGKLTVAAGWPIYVGAAFNNFVQVGALKVKLDSTYERGTDPSNAIPPWPRPTIPNPPPPRPIGPYAFSYWAKLPAGTALVAGKNTFLFYSNVNRHRPDPPPGLFFTFHVYASGGLQFPISWSGVASVTHCTNGVNELSYDVSLYVPEAATLSSDLVFFLQTAQASSGGAPNAG